MSDPGKNGESKKEPPDTMSEVDRLRVQVWHEKKMRLEAQMAALQIQLNQTQAEMAKMQPEREAFMKDTWSRYEMDLEDSVNLDTGKIERKQRQPQPKVNAQA